jgi:hypothetical protein
LICDVAPPFPSAGGLFAINAHAGDELVAMDFFHDVFSPDDSRRKCAL